MLNRNVSLGVFLCLAATTAFGDATTGTQYILEFPQANTSGARFQGYVADANSQTPVFDATGPTGVSQMVFKPDGSKSYILGTGGVQSVDPAFGPTSFHPINGITGTATTMSISPDGKWLYIGATNLFILNTATDAVVTNNAPFTGTVIGTTFSADSKYAYVLTNSPFGSSITQINTSNQQRVGQPLSLPFGGANAISMSPRQLIYVTDGPYIYEVDPVALVVTDNGQISTNISTLSPLRYVADGSTAYAINLTPSIGGRAIVKINLTTHVINELNFFNSGISPPAFVDVFPASASRVFALSGPDTTLWDVTPSPFAAAPSTSLAGSFSGGINNVIAAALSREQPSARYLFLLVANGQQTNLVRIDLATNSTTLNILATLGPGVLATGLVPPQSGASGFLPFNTNQTVKAGGTSLPLSAVVLNGTGLPVYNLPVTYSVDPNSGVTLSSTSQTTNKDGFVTITANVPTTPGNYVVTLTAGSVTQTYTLTVTGGSIGPGGGPSQVSIVSGNGQLFYSFQPSFNNPLVVKVVDTNGKPLPNTAVAFTIVSGPGSLDNANTATDQNGLASTDFIPSQPMQGVSFQLSDVSASTSVGSVDFKETTYLLNLDGTGQPQLNLISPGPLNGYTISAGEGDVITNGVVAQIFSSAPPDIGKGIPNVGIRIASGTDITMPGPASCQGSSLSDTSGTARCNLQISCQVGTSGISIVVGELRTFSAILKVGPGTSQALAIQSGNNQNGQAGQALGQVLVANVTDNCGTPIQGVGVTWKVTQGSATVTPLSSTSDAGGHVSAKVTLGQTPGTVTVTVSIGAAAQVAFTATNSVSVKTLTLVSGGGQSALTNQGFQQPLVFMLTDTNGNAVPGLQVNFSLVGGSAFLGATSATTNAAGQVSVAVTAGGTPGNVTIQASYNTLTATGTLTVKAPGPSLTANSFFSAASNKIGLVPCGIATASGQGLAPLDSGVVVGNPLGIGPQPYTIGKSAVSLAINGIPVPLFSLVNQNGVQQVTFQTPCEVSAGAATVVITINGATTNITGVQVFAAEPGIFTYAGPNSKLYGAVIRGLDGSYVTPSNLARRGETYFLVATGLGQTTPPAVTNATGAGQMIPISQVVLGVNNAGVAVLSAQYVAIGVYYVGFQLPSDAPTGVDQPLALGVIVGNTTVLDGQGALLPGVQ